MSSSNLNPNNQFIWVRNLVIKLKKIDFPFQKNIPLYRVIQVLYKQITQVGIAERASILSFNIMMAFPPSLMFIFSLTPYIPLLSGKFHKEALLVLKEVISDKLIYTNISSIVNDLFYKPKDAIYSLSFILFLFFASNAVLVMIKSFDKSIEHKRNRHFIVRRIVAIQVTLILFLFFIFLITFLNTEQYVVKSCFKYFNIHSLKIRTILVLSRNILSFVFIFFAIAFIYRFIPSIKKKWKIFSPGAFIASFCYVIIVIIFNYWTTNFMLYHQKYGALGTIIFVMTLIYLFSFILLLGFEINLSIDRVKELNKK